MLVRTDGTAREPGLSDRAFELRLQLYRRFDTAPVQLEQLIGHEGITPNQVLDRMCTQRRGLVSRLGWFDRVARHQLCFDPFQEPTQLFKACGHGHRGAPVVA